MCAHVQLFFEDYFLTDIKMVTVVVGSSNLTTNKSTLECSVVILVNVGTMFCDWWVSVLILV